MPVVLLRLRLVVFVLLYLPFHGLSYGYSALNGDYYVPDKDYGEKSGWSVGVNMPRKSCLTFTFFEGDAMLMLGGDHSRGDLNFFAMMSGKTWKYVGDKKYAVEVHYDGDLSWEGKGFGVEVSGYKGVTIENLTAHDVGRFARGNGLSLVVNGKTQARFSLDGAQDAVHRMLACALEVEAGRVPLDPTPSIIPSLDARNHPETAVAQANRPPKSDLLPTRPEPKREPAPPRPEAAIAASGRPVRYDQGGNWYVNIKKAEQVCLIDISFGKSNLYINSSPISDGLEYSVTLSEEGVILEKEAHNYKIRNERRVLSSGKAETFSYMGRGYFMISGVAETVVNDIAQSRILRVESGDSRLGEYDLSGFRRGFSRFFDCIKELGVSSPTKAREESDDRYDSGDDWSVFIDRAKRTCGVTLYYERRALLLNSEPPGARTAYFMTFIRDGWTPAQEEYELEIGNETQATVSVKAHTFMNDQTGFAVVNGLGEDFIDYITHSKLLRTMAKGVAPEGYLLGGFGHAFERFSDCLEEVRGEAPRPKVRRMN